MKQILMVCVASLCIALLVGALLGSWVWACASFALVLCIGLSPADFGLGRKTRKPNLDEEEQPEELDEPGYHN